MSEFAERSLKALIDAWAKVLLVDEDPDRPIDAALVNEWQAYAEPEMSKRLASTGISPRTVVEAICLGFRHYNTDPQSLDVIKAMANKDLVHPVDRRTARSLWVAGIKFEEPTDCQYVDDSLRLKGLHGMDLGDAVFVLRCGHSFGSVVQVIEDHDTVDPSTIRDLLRHGSKIVGPEWKELGADGKTRRQLQRNGIGPAQYKLWGRLTNPNLTSVLDAENLWSPNEAEEWMLALGVGYNDAADWFKALGDIRLARSWNELEYSLDIVIALRSHQVTSAEARRWSKLGVHGLAQVLAHRKFWNPDELSLWSAWDPDEALAWAKVFDEPSLATAWRLLPLPLDIAKGCACIGWDPATLVGEPPDKVIAALCFADEGVLYTLADRRSRLWVDSEVREEWIKSIGPELSLDALDSWFDSRLSLPVVIASVDLGLELGEAQAFADMGITTVEQLKRCAALWPTPSDLVEWPKVNFSVAEASEWASTGFSLDAASAWRDVGESPVRAQRFESYGCSPQAWAHYAKLGIDRDTAFALVLAEFEPGLFSVWQTKLSELNVIDVLAWFAVDSGLEQVAEWRAHGLSPAQAARL